MYKSLEKST